MAKDKIIPKGQETEEVGPTEKRHCTDVLFLIIFIAFWIGMFIVAGIAVDKGDPYRLIYGTDSQGNVCGVDNKNSGGLNLKDYKFLYFPDILDTKRSVCVEKCPKVGLSKDEVLALNSVTNGTCSSAARLLSSCQDVTLLPRTNNEAPLGNATATCCPYPSTSYLFRCLSDAGIDEFDNAINKDVNSADAADKALGDLLKTWEYQILLGFLALVFSFMWLLVIRYLGKYMVWATIIAVWLTMAAATAYVWNYAQESRNNESLQNLGSSADAVEGVDNKGAENNADTAEGIAIFLAVCTVIVFLITVFLRKRINLACDIIAEATRALAAMPLLVFYPILPVIAIGLLAMYWLWIFLYIVSAYQESKSANNSADYGEDQITDDDIRRLGIYHFFGFLWTLNWFLALTELVIAGAVASWYFTRDKTQLGSTPILSSLKRTTLYHMGSAALGSLIVAIVQMIRAINAYLREQVLRKNDSTIVKALFCLIDCCLRCIEALVKFINRNGYIMVAIYGTSFCAGAKKAFDLLIANMARVAAVNWVTSFLLFLGKLIVVFLVVIISVGIFQDINNDDKNTELTYWVVPVIFAAIVAYAIASAFMEVFDMTVDTIFLCFLHDEDRVDHGAEPYASENLRKAIQKGSVASKNPEVGLK